MQEQKLNNYISLDEATKHCKYSQEYLSLRARQKKLKAVKLGRNWFTTKEWLSEYLLSVDDYKKNLKTYKKTPACRQAGFGPPVNLPTGDFDLLPVRPVSDQIFQGIYNIIGMILGCVSLKRVVITVAILLLMATGSLLSKPIIKEFVRENPEYFIAISKKVEKIIGNDELEAIINEIKIQVNKEIEVNKKITKLIEIQGGKIMNPAADISYNVYCSIKEDLTISKYSLARTMRAGWKELEEGWETIIDYSNIMKHFVRHKSQEITEKIVNGVDYLIEPWKQENLLKKNSEVMDGIINLGKNSEVYENKADYTDLQINESKVLGTIAGNTRGVIINGGELNSEGIINSNQEPKINTGLLSALTKKTKDSN